MSLRESDHFHRRVFVIAVGLLNEFIHLLFIGDDVSLSKSLVSVSVLDQSAEGFWKLASEHLIQELHDEVLWLSGLGLVYRNLKEIDHCGEVYVRSCLLAGRRGCGCGCGGG